MSHWKKYFKEVVDPDSGATKRIRQKLAEEGYELTRPQLVDLQRDIISKLRKFLAARNINISVKSDEEVFELVMQVLEQD